MIDFKFFLGQETFFPSPPPTNRNEVRTLIYSNLSILYDGCYRPNFEVEVESLTDMMCQHLNIE